jgi:outer membrane protein
MKRKTGFSLLALVLSLLAFGQVRAQGAQSFTLQQSIDYAIRNKPSMANARLQQDVAKAKVGEIRAMGLPQINGSAEVGDNFKVPTSFIPGEFFNQPGTFVPVQFGIQYNASAGVNASQMLFDGAFLIGLKAAQTYTDLSRKEVIQTATEVAEAVTKAYYGVLVNRERLTLLDRNLERLQNLLRETEQIYQQGFAEKLDVDRLQVSYNNLKVEKQKAGRLAELSEGLLKFQMGIAQNQEVELTGQLSDIVVNMAKVDTDDFNYAQRIEYSILETQRDLAMFDLRNKRANYLPKLYLTARYGVNTASQEFGRIFRFSEKNSFGKYNYFPYGFVGVNLQVPIFQGLRKKYQVQQAELALESAKNGFRALEESIDLQLKQAKTNLQNAMEVLDSQKASLALAEEVARVTRIKFQEGVGTNLEVVNAETSLREAQTNYYVALYDAIIAKVDLDKATGTLVEK